MYEENKGEYLYRVVLWFAEWFNAPPEAKSFRKGSEMAYRPSGEPLSPTEGLFLSAYCVGFSA